MHPGCGCYLFLIICSAIACDANQLYKKENCVAMSPAKEYEIQAIVSKIGDYLNEIAREYEHFDIRLVKIAMEGHKDIEEEKDTRIEVLINDCNDVADGNKGGQNRNGLNENEIKNPNPKPPVEVFQLNLDENGEELLSLMEKSRRRKYKPLVVYVQERNGGNRKEYTLLN